jgi:hypothetical protein
MPVTKEGYSLTQIARIGGVEYNTIKARAEMWGLSPPFKFPHFFDLKPKSADKMGFEEARTRDMAARAELNEIELETKRKERIPVEVLNAALAQAFAEIRATIDGSELNQKAKDDICEAIKNAPARLRW